MSDLLGAQAPAEPGAGATPPAPAAPAAPPAEPAAPAGGELPPLPPQLEEALKKTGIPDMLTAPLREQLRVSEREHQKALEQARSNSAPPEWAELVRQAQAAGVTPDVMLNAYNASLRIMEDPVGFSIQLNEQIDKLIAAGQLTAREGYRMKQEAAAEIAATVNGAPGADPLETPEQRQIRELAEQQQQLQQQLSQREQAEQQRQAEQEAAKYADHFMDVLDQATTGASDQVKQFIGHNASSLLSNDTSGQLTPEKAIEMAVENAKAIGVTWQAQQPQGQQPQTAAAPPVGSSAAIPGQAPEKLPPAGSPEGKRAREEKMLAVAASLVAQGD